MELPLCVPAIVYLLFSIVQIVIDVYNRLYQQAGMKMVVTIMITLLLNLLCKKGFESVAWFIVFIPFLLMAVIVGMLLYIFGLDVAGEGDYKFDCEHTICNETNGIQVDPSGNLIIYHPQYNALMRPVYYQYPNIIVPNPLAKPPTMLSPPVGSSSPAYQS